MTKIIVDSTCDYTPQEAEQTGVTMLPLKVSFGKDEYLDKITITNEQFYNKLNICEELPKTALVSVGEFLDAYEKYPDDDLIVITISEKLSGTFQAALSAKSISGRSNIHVVDSKSASLGFALVVDKAVELIKSYSVIEAADILRTFVDRVRIVGIVDTLKYLVKGGRLSALQGSVGGLLGIKPILLIKHGEIISLAKARGTSAAIEKLNELFKTKFKIDRKEEIIFGHANNERALTDFKQMVGTIKKSRTLTIGSVVGTHTGPGVICVAFFEHKLVGAKIMK